MIGKTQLSIIGIGTWGIGGFAERKGRESESTNSATFLMTIMINRKEHYNNMSVFFTTKNFIVESHPKPFVSRADGGHIRIRVKDGDLREPWHTKHAG